MIFGQTVAVLMRSRQHKFLPRAEWLVLLAVLGGQYSVAQAQLSGTTVPVGLALLGQRFDRGQSAAFGFVGSRAVTT